MFDKTATLVCVVIGAMLLTARAGADPDPDTEAPPAPPAAAASAEGADQLTLPRGRLLLDAFAEISLSSGAVGKPISISPDLWYGATDDITVGLVHSGLAASGFIGAAGNALCLTGTTGGCAKLYPGAGLDVRYKLKTKAGGFAWAADGGLYALALDPFQLAIKLGVAGRWHSGKLAIELLPNLFLGLTNRSPAPPVMGMVAVAAAPNQETLNIPVTGLYSIAPKAAVAVQLGVVLPLENAGNAYAIPLSIGGHYQATDDINLNLAFSLPFLVAGGAQSGFDARTLTIGGSYAF